MVRTAALKVLAFSLGVSIAAQPVGAASYLCSPKQRFECLNGKPCKPVSVKNTEHFIVDVSSQVLEDCDLEDCHTQSVLFWKTEHNPLIVSHRDIPRTTRFGLAPRSVNDETSFTQATLSSVMTVVQTGTCFERPTLAPVSPPPSKQQPN